MERRKLMIGGVMVLGVMVALVVGLNGRGSNRPLSVVRAESAVAAPVQSTAADSTSIEANITANGYPTIVVEAGKPVNINFKASQNALNGCNNEIIMPDFNVDLPLVVGDNWVTITPDKVGEYEYTCWMGMVSGKLIVVEPGTQQTGATVTDPTQRNAGGCPMMSGANGGGGCCGR